MALQSVATENPTQDPAVGSSHSLWISDDSVLTVHLDKSSSMFPPTLEHVQGLNEMICGLARAAKAVIYQAENDTSNDSAFQLQPIADLADAIVLLSQLANAVQTEECNHGN